MPYDVISIIGNAKNAGKTTVLNSLVENYRTQIVGLTSIGMDGEAIDNVTHLPKPRIKVFPGFLVATAKSCLEAADASYSLVETTAIRTPLGPVEIVRIETEGNFLIAGPSVISEMETIVAKLKRAGCAKVFVDGAFSRHSSAKLGTAAILVLGANRSPVMDVVVNEAGSIVAKLTIPEAGIAFGELNDCDLITAIDDNGIKHYYDESSTLIDPEKLFAWIDQAWTYLYIPYAVGSGFFKLMLKDKQKRFNLIMNDPTSLQPEPNLLKHIVSLKTRLLVLRPVNLVAVCLNPVSPRGYAFEEPLFRQALETKLGLPVINVLKEERDTDE